MKKAEKDLMAIILKAARQENNPPAPSAVWHRQVMASVHRCAATAEAICVPVFPVRIWWRLAAAALVIAMICTTAYIMTPASPSATELLSGIPLDSFENTIITVAGL